MKFTTFVKWEQLRPLLPPLIEALSSLKPRTLARVEAQAA